MARSKAELEELLAEAESVIEDAASLIEEGDLKSAKSRLDEHLESDEGSGEEDLDEGT